MKRPDHLLRYAIYARVSTTDQNCEMQLKDLRAERERRGGTLVGEYVDTGWSGAKKDRPSLNRLLADVAAGKIDVVLTWKIDRFGRNLKNFMEHIDILTKHGVRFVSITQGIDTADETGMGAFFLRLLVLVAELELSLIKERTAASRLRRMTDETPDSWNLPQLIFEVIDGFPRFKKGGQELAQLLFQWREEGNSVYEIEELAAARGIKAARGGRLEHSSIMKLLKSRCMIAEYKRNKKTYAIKDREGRLLRPVLEDQYFRVQKTMEEVKDRKQGRPSDSLLLRGWVRCHRRRKDGCLCGSRCVGHNALDRKGGKVLYYRCFRSTDKKHREPAGQFCLGCYLNAARTDAAVWRALWDQVFSDPQNVRELGLAWVAEEEAAKGDKRDPHKLLKAKRAELGRIEDMYQKSVKPITFEEYERRANPVREEIESLEIEARSMNRVREIAPLDKIAAACARISRREPQEFKHRRAILEMLVNLTVVKMGDELEISAEFPVAEEAAMAGGSGQKNRGHRLAGVASSFQPVPFRIRIAA